MSRYTRYKFPEEVSINVVTETGRYIYQGPAADFEPWHKTRLSTELQSSTSIPTEQASQLARSIIPTPLPDLPSRIVATERVGQEQEVLTPASRISSSSVNSSIAQKKDASGESSSSTTRHQVLSALPPDQRPATTQHLCDTIDSLQMLLQQEHDNFPQPIVHFCKELVKDVQQALVTRKDTDETFSSRVRGLRAPEMSQVLSAFLATLRTIHGDVVVFDCEDDFTEVAAHDRDATIHEVHKAIDVCDASLSPPPDASIVTILTELRAPHAQLCDQHPQEPISQKSPTCAKARVQEAIRGLEISHPCEEMVAHLHWCHRVMSSSDGLTARPDRLPEGSDKSALPASSRLEDRATSPSPFAGRDLVPSEHDNSRGSAENNDMHTAPTRVDILHEISGEQIKHRVIASGQNTELFSLVRKGASVSLIASTNSDEKLLHILALR